MNSILEEMISKYAPNNNKERENAVKEVLQEIALAGLSRGDFFEKAAFYGGTCLRVFHGLDRFSEDLDFSLITKNESFDLSSYFSMIEKEISAFGLIMKIEMKNKTNESNIKSAFLKGDTKEHMMYFYSNMDLTSGIPNGELLKIKFEVDVNPPSKASYETKYSLIPVPYEIKLYDLSSLFDLIFCSAIFIASLNFS